MTMYDGGYKGTEKALLALEARISRIYQQARDGLQDTVEAYFKAFEKRDAEMQSLVRSGQVTKEHYTQWRLAQMGRGARYEALRDEMAARYTNANQVAISYVNDATPGIYSLNRNYAAYTIEQVAGDVGFTALDEQTVKRLAVESPDLMPNYPKSKAVKRGIDLVYGKQQITASITSSILQGKSIKGIADDLQARISDMNRTSAIRAARTAATGAQNAGRMDCYTAAEQKGIALQKEWLATLDGRTRHSHAALDGERVNTEEKFPNGCRFPGDPQGAPREVYNCRCTIVAAVGGWDVIDALRRVIDPVTGKGILIQEMTYQEWAKWKKSENCTAWEALIRKGKNLSADQKQFEEYKAVLGKRIPVRIEDFQNLKYNEVEKWKMLKLDKSRRSALANHPDLALPGDEKVIPTGKFTGYFFNPDNPDGWAKGQAFESRLGYSAENWQKLQREILTGAERYIASLKKQIEYGDLYEQKMVLYGETGNPANVVVGWIHKRNGITSMTTAYIKEV